jgi:molybdopterin synthase sulfur carrier subunit
MLLIFCCVDRAQRLTFTATNTLWVPSLDVKVRFFTRLREIVGKREETLTFPDKATVTVNTVLKVLSGKYCKPFIEYVYNEKGKPQNFLQFLINGTSTATLNGTETLLQNGDELVILPPVGGG